VKILVAGVPNLAGGCRLPTAGGAVTIADARHPDWGPADVPESGAAQPQPATTNPDTTKPATATPAAHHGAPESLKPKTLSLRGRRLARALRHGVVVKLSAPAPGRISARALRGKRVVATGSAKAARAGTVALRLRFNARARRQLRGRRPVRLTILTTFRGA
jgi:hypothetical protein